MLRLKRMMPKIATTTELAAELQKLIEQTSADRPSRSKLASSLLSLSQRVAGSLHLGPGKHQVEASAQLKRMKRFRKRPDGSLNSALEVAAGLAKQQGKEMWVYGGNSNMHAVWRIVDNERKTLGFDNGAKNVYRLTPDLDLYSHSVLGRIEMPSPE